MNISGKFLTAAAVAVTTLCGPLTARADRYRGEKTLGVCVGYNTSNKRPLAGAQFSYRFNRLLRLTPSVEYVFRNNGLDALMLDLDMEFVFPLAQGRCDIYPLAGLNFSSWNYHPSTPPSLPRVGNLPSTDDVSSRVSRFGLNAGAGFGVNITRSLRLSVTAAYTFIEEFHGANITAGIHYRF